LRVWQRAHQYDPGRSSLGTWLFRIARNLHFDRVRGEPASRQAQEYVDELDSDSDEQPSPTQTGRDRWPRPV